MLYLSFSGILGYEIVTGLLLPAKKRQAEGANQIWFLAPVSLGIGILLLTWMVYAVSWLVSVCAGTENPLFYGNLAGVLTGAAAVL